MLHLNRQVWNDKGLEETCQPLRTKHDISTVLFPMFLQFPGLPEPC